MWVVEGNFEDYEEDEKRRLGGRCAGPKRLKLNNIVQ